jgi:hypothetical protein
MKSEKRYSFRFIKGGWIFIKYCLEPDPAGKLLRKSNSVIPAEAGIWPL